MSSRPVPRASSLSDGLPTFWPRHATGRWASMKSLITLMRSTGPADARSAIIGDTGSAPGLEARQGNPRPCQETRQRGGLAVRVRPDRFLGPCVRAMVRAARFRLPCRCRSPRQWPCSAFPPTIPARTSPAASVEPRRRHTRICAAPPRCFGNWSKRGTACWLHLARQHRRQSRRPLTSVAVSTRYSPPFALGHIGDGSEVALFRHAGPLADVRCSG